MTTDKPLDVDTLEAAASELFELRRLLNSQFEAVDIAREDAIYAICIDAIRAMKRSPFKGVIRPFRGAHDGIY